MLTDGPLLQRDNETFEDRRRDLLKRGHTLLLTPSCKDRLEHSLLARDVLRRLRLNLCIKKVTLDRFAYVHVQTLSYLIQHKPAQRSRDLVELLEVVMEELSDAALLLSLSLQCIQVLRYQIADAHHRLDLLGGDAIGIEDP